MIVSKLNNNMKSTNARQLILSLANAKQLLVMTYNICPTAGLGSSIFFVLKSQV